MNRRILLVIVLCLAFTTLGIGAATAMAADGCTCHTADPPTAKAAHARLVASVADCTVCHAGMTVPHPTLGAPRLTFEAVAHLAPDGKEQIVLRGQLGANTKEINGVVVYMQQRAAGASEFTDVAQMTTRPVIMSGPGRFWSQDATLAEGMSYRAISQGKSDAVILAPRMRTVMVTPALALWKMRGLRNGILRLGRRVRAIGRAAPSWFVGDTVRLTLKKGPDRHQRVVRRVERTIGDGGLSGDFQWTFTPKTRGEYALYARWLATDEHPGVSAIEAWFHVK